MLLIYKNRMVKSTLYFARILAEKNSREKIFLLDLHKSVACTLARDAIYWSHPSSGRPPFALEIVLGRRKGDSTPQRGTVRLDDTTFIYPDEFLELFLEGISSERELCLVQFL